MKFVFVLGMPRSGTTLMSQMLDSHPDVMMSPSMDFLQTSLQDLGLQELPGHAHLQEFGLDEPKLLGRGMAAMVRSLLMDYAEARRARTKKIASTLGTKMMAWPPKSIAMIDKGFSCVTWVVVFRDPADTFVSTRKQTWGTKSPAPFLKFWRAYHQHVAKFGPQVQWVGYERLVRDPEETMCKLLSLMELEWNEAVVRPHEHPHDDVADATNVSTFALGNDPIGTKAIGRAVELSTAEQQLFVNGAGKLLAALRRRQL